MSRILFFSISLFLLSEFASAQTTHTITGRVTDLAGSPLVKAGISLVHLKDSSFVTTVFTNDKGIFEISGLKDTSYRLLITYLGYQQINRIVNFKGDRNIRDFGILKMRKKVIGLQGVNVHDIAPPVALKGDTLVFNAGSFHIRPNAVVEELLKKIPGITVEKDGTIKVQGETVKTILVDGKPFFGNDPTIATKNLPANIVDKVQVFDKSSDQEAFTGFEDANTRKTINLTVKEDKKIGLFGSASTGAGTDGRFATSLNAFRFNNDQQISLIANGNNTNNLGFKFIDIRISDESGPGLSKNVDAGFTNRPGRDGITTSWMTGLNFHDEWSEKLKLSGSYFYNHTSNDINRQQHRQNIFRDSSNYTNQKDETKNTSANHRINMRLDYQIDSFNSILFIPSISYTTNDFRQQSQFTGLGNNKQLLYEGTRNYHTSATAPKINGELLYRRRFNKKGRTFSLGLTGGFNKKKSSGNQSSSIQYYTNNLTNADTIDQQFLQDNKSKNWGISLTYTEPILKDHLLMLRVSHDKTTNYSNKQTYNRNPVTGKFENLDTTYSNDFRNHYNTNFAEISLQTRRLQYFYTLGFNMEQNKLNSYSITSDTTFNQKNINFYPRARFDYTFPGNKRLRFDYKGSVQQPSIEQLQPVKDNTDPLRIQRGNPNLRNSFTNHFNLNYRSSNMNSYKLFLVGLQFSTTTNDIVSSHYYNYKGQDSIRFVNADGAYYGNVFFTAGFSLAENKNMLSTQTSANLNRNISFVNGKKNYTQIYNMEERIRFSYIFRKLFDFNLSGYVAYNHSQRSLQNQLNADYFNYGGTFDFHINLPANFRFRTNFDYTVNAGLSQGYDKEIAMWNASVSKLIFKEQQGEIELRAFDLLNQQASIQRNVSDNYIQDVQTNVIPQYFMLSFTYFFNKFQVPGQHATMTSPLPGGALFNIR